MSTTMNSTQPIAANQGLSLTASELDRIVGGGGTTAQTTTPFLAFTFKLVAVKTVSWAHD